MDFINIPEERVGVLIGPNGATKRDIQKRGKVKISVEGTSVSIDGEGISAWKCRDVVQAIGRGFNPEYAFMLFNDDYVFEMINLKDFGTERSWERLRGRVIGEGGKIRRIMEKDTGALISVYGKTVSLIGTYDEVDIAKEAVIMLLGGSKHGAVRRFLEQQKRNRISNQR